MMFGKVSDSKHEWTNPCIRLCAQTDVLRVPHTHTVLETDVAADARGSVDELEDGHPGVDDLGQSGILRNGQENMAAILTFCFSLFTLFQFPSLSAYLLSRSM